MSDGWRSRIVEYGEEDPEQLLANPANWRIHPKYQQDALEGVLDEVGWVDDIIVNRITGNVLDGHLRITLSLRRGEKAVPVKYVELSEAEEALVLSTFDPISALAVADREALGALLQDVQSDDAAVQAMLAGLARREKLYLDENGQEIDPWAEWQGMPKFGNEPRAARTLYLHFQTHDDVKDFADQLGLSITEKTKSVWYPESPENIKGIFIE